MCRKLVLVREWPTYGPNKSVVYYPNEVAGAQDALNSNPQTTDTVAMQKVVQTIG